MRHSHSGPYTVKVTSRYGTQNPQALPLPAEVGLRKAREVARQAAENGEKNAAHAAVYDAGNVVCYECRNIRGKAVQVQGVRK